MASLRCRLFRRIDPELFGGKLPEEFVQLVPPATSGAQQRLSDQSSQEHQRRAGNVLRRLVAEIPLKDRALYPPGMQWYWKGDFGNELSEEAIAAHVKHGTQLPTMLSTMHIYPINGAVHRVDEGDTAWSYRDVEYSQVIVGVDPDPANTAKITRWAKEYWEAIDPCSAGAAYVNFMMHDEGQGRIKATYRGNYARLVEVKNRYDPHNLFRVNQNIKPTV